MGSPLSPILADMIL